MERGRQQQQQQHQHQQQRRCKRGALLVLMMVVCPPLHTTTSSSSSSSSIITLHSPPPSSCLRSCPGATHRRWRGEDFYRIYTYACVCLGGEMVCGGGWGGGWGGTHGGGGEVLIGMCVLILPCPHSSLYTHPRTHIPHPIPHTQYKPTTGFAMCWVTWTPASRSTSSTRPCCSASARRRGGACGFSFFSPYRYHIYICIYVYGCVNK
jgi:hypothetical protein